MAHLSCRTVPICNPIAEEYYHVHCRGQWAACVEIEYPAAACREHGPKRYQHTQNGDDYAGISSLGEIKRTSKREMIQLKIDNTAGRFGFVHDTNDDEYILDPGGYAKEPDHHIHIRSVNRDSR